MKSRNRLFPAALFALAAIGSVLMLMGPSVVQGNSGVSSLGTPDDWTHHHLIFSHPGSFSDAVQRGSFESWYRVVSDPRYIMQLRKRGGASNRATTASGSVAGRVREKRRRRSTLHRDWGMSLQAGGSVHNAMYPAKYTFDVNATPDCLNDYVAFTTGHTGSATAPSIIAFDELYSTQVSNCLGNNAGTNTGPEVKWAYYMNTGVGVVVTSPVISFDGTKIAYVETSAANHAVLRLLKWKPGAAATVQGTLDAPSLPDTIMTAGQNWTTDCPAANSCIASITFSGNPQDTTSSPFYDYTAGNLYVGSNNGRLHKFTGVFTGTPAEVTTGGWPIIVNAGNALTGPVFDSRSGNIFVGDASGRLSYVREVGSTKGACLLGTPPCLGSTNQALGGHIVDPPIVDSSNGTVFAFDGQTGAGNNTAEVMQTDTALTTIATVGFVNNGSASVANMHPGTFDNTYFNGAAGSGVGKLYVCAQGTANTDRPTLFRISFTAGTGANLGSSVMNSAADAGSLELVNGDGEDCSPITETNNTAASAEWIFWSVGHNSSVPTGSACTTGANGGCLIALNLTALGATWPPAATGVYFASYKTPLGPAYTSIGGGTIRAAGTSGIVVDNVAATGIFPQASSIYFSFTSNSTAGAPCNGTTGVGCAIKLTQSGLN